MSIDMSLIGKDITTLTPAQLASLQSQLAALTAEVDARKKVKTEEITRKEFAKIEKIGADVAKILGWEKFPKLQLIPNDAGDAYTVDYVAVKKPGTRKATGEKRTASEPGTGKITINKIITAMGELDHFEAGGKNYTEVKVVVKDLKQADGKSEAERCWEISKKGISGSDIITKNHAKEVTLVFKNGTRVSVEDAVKQLSEARKETTAPDAPPAEPGTEAPPV